MRFYIDTRTPRFLDFIERIEVTSETSGWSSGPARFQDRVKEYREVLNARGFVYLPTGGGEHGEPGEYGDAVVTMAFIEDHWNECGGGGWHGVGGGAQRRALTQEHLGELVGVRQPSWR